MVNLQKYPLDIESLTKGDTIDIPTLEIITSEEHGTDKFNFALMSLQAKIQNETDFTVRISSKNGLEVLTDAEASKHNHKVFVQAINSTKRRFQLNSQVDQDQLTDDQKKKHERNLLVEGSYVSAISQARKTIRLAGHQRSVPDNKPPVQLPEENDGKKIKIKV